MLGCTSENFNMLFQNTDKNTEKNGDIKGAGKERGKDVNLRQDGNYENPHYADNPKCSFIALPLHAVSPM